MRNELRFLLSKCPSLVDFNCKVITNPFVSRFDLSLKAEYELLQTTPTLSFSNNLERNLSSHLSSSYLTFVNENVHLFLNSIRLNTVLFNIPNNKFFLNAHDWKSGDLLKVENGRITNRIECKSFELLTASKAADISRQYKWTNNFDQVDFSVLYKDRATAESKFIEVLLDNLKIDKKQIFLISLEELESVCTVENLNRFFKLYGELEFSNYILQRCRVEKILAEEVLQWSSDEGLKKKFVII